MNRVNQADNKDVIKLSTYLSAHFPLSYHQRKLGDCTVRVMISFSLSPSHAHSPPQWKKKLLQQPARGFTRVHCKCLQARFAMCTIK